MSYARATYPKSDIVEMLINERFILGYPTSVFCGVIRSTWSILYPQEKRWVQFTIFEKLNKE